MAVADAFLRLYEIVRALRAPDGCAWDRSQTPESLREHLLEETYETIEAVDSGDAPGVCEELGDVYLLVTMMGIIYEEHGSFTVEDALVEICEKLVRRHPHVFGDSDAETHDEIIDQWNRIKVEQEGKRRKDALLDGVSTALPSLERANKLQRKAAKVGFDWPNLEGVVGKLHEEVDEVLAAASQGDADGETPSRELESEVGDLLFSAVNVARFLRVDPSIALHRANQKFVRRFGEIERTLNAQGSNLEEANLSEMERIWQASKQNDGEL
jgi:tetrapyrrole methylase family protein/MazG family protein